MHQNMELDTQFECDLLIKQQRGMNAFINRLILGIIARKVPKIHLLLTCYIGLFLQYITCKL